MEDGRDGPLQLISMEIIFDINIHGEYIHVLRFSV